jgi:hypothetical protein
MALTARQFDPDIDHDWVVVRWQSQNRVFKKSKQLWP